MPKCTHFGNGFSYVKRLLCVLVVHLFPYNPHIYNSKENVCLWVHEINGFVNSIFEYFVNLLYLFVFVEIESEYTFYIHEEKRRTIYL